MPNQGRGRLDSAIDRAVRDMMQVDAPAGLRHRVSERIVAPARRGSWLVPAFAAAAVCLVLLASAVLLRAPRLEPQAPRPVTIAPAPETPAPPPARTPAPLPSIASSRTTPRPAAATSESIFGARTGRVSAATVDTSVVTPEFVPTEPPPGPGALAPLAPISIAPIQVEPITIAPVTVRAIPHRY